MILWTAAVSAALVILIVIFILYRRQVKEICRQLAFLKENPTNMRLTSQLPLAEVNKLIDEVNDLLDRSRELRKESLHSETQLKETITSLSHDIRTPLTSLDGYFQLLQESMSEEERLRYIEIIQTRIESLKDMLEELFTYARLQDHEYRLELGKTDFGQCVYDTVFSFYQDFQKRGIEPEADFCDGRIYVRGNEEALRRGIQNMIKNALVHGYTQISFKLYKTDKYAGFRCSNDTEHPDEIDIRQVFGRFYKADSARTQNSTGLGLSITKELARRMGGTAEASLEKGIFSVDFLIPLVEEKPYNS